MQNQMEIATRSVGIHPRSAAAMQAAISSLNDAIALLDALSDGNTTLSLAAAHAETALQLVGAEFMPSVLG